MQSNKSSSKLAKLKSPSSGVSPLMMKYFSSNSSSNSSSPVDPFSPLSKISISSSSNSNSNHSPLSAVDEDVLVMDGILLNSSSSSSSSGSNIDGSFYKTELCRSWEDFGKCRFGTRCQFAHGKEDLRLTRFSVAKNKSDAQICRSYITGSCLYGSKCRFVHHQHQVMIDAVAPGFTAQTPSPPQHNTTKTSATATKTVQTTRTISNRDLWLPQDDGIQVALPSSQPPSREEVDAYIATALYYPTARRRLPVFSETCPD